MKTEICVYGPDSFSHLNEWPDNAIICSEGISLRKVIWKPPLFSNKTKKSPLQSTKFSIFIVHATYQVVLAA